MPKRRASSSTPADRVAGHFGARGSGKTFSVQAALGRPPRMLGMDPMNQFEAHALRVASLAEMVKRARGASTFQLRYVPPDITECDDAELAARFDVFCRLAWALAPVDMVVDEGHLFTSASAAPKAWRACTLLGRHRGIRIWLMSQRPAHVDKHFFSNATYLRTGRLNFGGDVAAMAEALGVPREAVARLSGHEWIARDMLTGALSWDAGERVGALLGEPVADMETSPRREKKSVRRRRC